MFCYQCEQTFRGTGCTTLGVCGKDETTATLQDLLVHATKGISMYAHRAAQLGASDAAVDRGVIEGLFATVTNVDFDPQRLQGHLAQAAAVRDKARTMYEAACRTGGQDGRETRRTGGLAAGGRPRRPGPPRRRGLGHAAAGRPGPGRRRPAGIGHLRPERGGRLCRSRLSAGPRRPGHLRHLPRSPRLPHPRRLHRRRHPRLGDEDRRAEPQGHGPAGRGQHRRLRPSRADASPRHAHPGQGDRGLRPRPEGPRRAAQADRRPRHQRLYPRRDAPLPRLSGPEEVQAPGGQLRRRLAGPGQGVRRVPRRRADDDQLHPEAAGKLPRPHFHQRAGRLAGRGPHRPRPRLHAGDPGRAGGARLRRRRRRSRRPLPSASAATPCWAWPTR